MWKVFNMGFEINNFHKPIIKEAQTVQDGGAGNTGYFEQDEKRKQQEKDKSIFDAESTDAFVKNGAQENVEEDFSFTKWIAQIILAVKDWFKKLSG